MGKIIKINDLLSDEENESFRANTESIKNKRIITEAKLKEVIPNFKLFNYKLKDGTELTWRI